MRLAINYRKKTVKNTNTWRLNNTLLNNQQITEEIKEEIKKYLETNDNQNTTIWTSLVAQWLKIHLPMQGTQVRALVWEDATCRGATKPVCHNY